MDTVNIDSKSKHPPEQNYIMLIRQPQLNK